MVLRRKRRLLFGLGLTVSFGLVAALPAAATAASTLTGETLSGSSSQGNSGICPAPTFSVGGTASGPYSGMFQESGTWSPGPASFSATFTITSGTTTITGNKTRGGGSWVLSCGGNGNAFAHTPQSPYTATIHTPNGNFHDEGTSAVDASTTGAGAATLTESFTSSLAEPVLIVPTSKRQCKKGGWRDYPQFKNQGSCVRFIVTGKQPVAQHQSSPGQSKAPGGGNRSKAPK